MARYNVVITLGKPTKIVVGSSDSMNGARRIGAKYLSTHSGDALAVVSGNKTIGYINQNRKYLGNQMYGKFYYAAYKTYDGWAWHKINSDGGLGPNTNKLLIDGSVIPKGWKGKNISR